MDILRRIFGLQPAAQDLDGPTAPLDERRIGGQPLVATRTVVTTPTKDNDADDAADDTLQFEDDDGHTRRLPEYDSSVDLRHNGRRITYGQHTDQGQVRNNNQDAIISFLSSSASVDDQPEFGVFIVADGMGGHHDGEKASALTSRTVLHHISSKIFLPMLLEDDDLEDRPKIAEVMREAVQKANDDVSSKVPEGSTTVNAVAIMGDLAYIGHVGDSRAYLITAEGIEQLTRDHSLVQRLIELEQLTPEEAAEHPQRNVLYRAIGQSDAIDVDAITRRLLPGSRLLICSDGLWNLVSDEEIYNMIIGSPSPQKACETLVKVANERGGPDNISVILVRVPE